MIWIGATINERIKTRTDLHRFLVFQGLDNKAATLHDSFYSNPIMSRKLADRLFLEAIRSDKTTPNWKAKLAYYAVRLCGKKVRFDAYGINNE